MQPTRQFSSTGSCPCGTSSFDVGGKLLTRFLCHCAICQDLYKAPYADVTTFWAGAITVNTPESVGYKRYRAPPALQRGTCKKCGAPVVGFMWLAPFTRLAFVPTRNLKVTTDLPTPSAHIFYHRRVADASDKLPKHSGYWRSELAVAGLVLRGAAR